MLSALGFLAVVGGSHAPDRRTLGWFPVVGAGLGGALALVWEGTSRWWEPGVAAVLVVAADLALTGLLHVDGLADSADGLLPHLGAERRLEVMRAPDVGAFALGVVPVVLLARWVALAGGAVAPLALVAVWSASRTLAATAPALVPYARSSGLASAFVDGARWWTPVWLVPCGVLLAAVHALAGVVALAVAVVVAAALVAGARQRVGGFTGDLLGAVILVSETAALLTLAASP